MPYDPRMMAQMGRMGMDMMGPQGPQASPANMPAQRPKQWWEGLPPMGVQQQPGQGAPGTARPPASLLEMLMASGGKAGSMPGTGAAGMGAASPWMYLSGLLGGGGGAR